jgi:tetratricopeptide (TPR) repeat protein
MKILFLSFLLCAAPSSALGGDRERGLQLYREGRYQEAAEAFRAALTSEGDSPDLQYDLALASWRAGELAAAEIAVEKFAAQSAGAGADLHAGVLGGVRYDEAKALEHKADGLLAAGGQPAVPVAPGQSTEKPEDPLALLEQALAKVTQAKDHFVQGAVAARSPELLRNTERAVRYQNELQKKIDELKKQQEEQKKDDDKKDDKDKEKKDDKDKKDDSKKDDKSDDKKQDDKDSKSDDKKQDDQKGDPKDQKPDEGKDGESKPEPKPGEQDDKDPKEPKPEDGKPDPSKSKDPKPGEQKDEPKPEDGKPEDQKREAAQPRNDAPGEAQEGKELTAEQTQRLLEELRDLDEKQKAYRARAKSSRRAVERDW